VGWIISRAECSVTYPRSGEYPRIIPCDLSGHLSRGVLRRNITFQRNRITRFGLASWEKSLAYDFQQRSLAPCLVGLTS
jgi:hypothetical protein